ncbi:NACHT domain-containing protein [Oscillatoria sp. CS-180]|nr:NACHT domain-containing protein [Oscillatoria sp. CS-180]MDB9528577.1 NACHT domain-containing protein [Oscillatoria sp. CS-180]
MLEIFRQTPIQALFREALDRNTPSILLKNGEDFLASHPLQSDLQANNVDVRREFYAFAAVFIEVAKRTRTPAEILAEQKLDSMHRQIGSLQERLNRLPTIEGMRTEMARLAAQDYAALPGAAATEPFSAEQCKAFALAQQIRGWFETLGFRFESHDVWQDDHFEWIINIPIRRGRYDRILVRGIDGEAGLSDVEDLKASVETHQTDEGWLVTARRISRAARDEVEKADNDGLGCYTLDELLDQDADFSGYLTWLEAEIQKRGIDQKYVPLACLKDEIDPDTRQRIGVSRYGDRDGWIDGYIDLWLDDPAKEHISVLGEFGTGKTWFAFHYAWQALQRYREAQQRGLERPRLPLVVPLRDYAKAVSVESLFSEFFFRKHEIPIPGYSAFEQLNRMGKLLLIFDGFDEMAARVDRQQMINNFWELAKVVVPGAKVILTCRTEHFPEAKEGRALLNAELQASTKDLTGETPQFEVLELEKFDDEQIHQVLSHQAQPATVEQIMGNPELLDLARRPVLTELILEALPDIEAGKPVDMSRVYLYAVRHKMERDIKAERTFTSMADKLYFMCELSWEMLSSDRMSINYREFPDRIRKLFGPAVEEQKDLDHWHYDMMGQTMLIRNAEGDYTPAHRSLLEFFVAYKFAAELDILAPDFSEMADLAYFKDHVNLNSTFGKEVLEKAVIELILPMLDLKESIQKKLLHLILNTRNQSISEVRSIAGNAATLLLRFNHAALAKLDLSRTIIVGGDFTRAILRETNFSYATFSRNNFAQSFGAVFSVTFNVDSSLLATGHLNGEICLWDSDARKLTSHSGHADLVRAVAFSPDSRLLATGSYDRSIKLWDISNRVLLEDNCITILKGHDRPVRSVSFSPDGKILASGSEDHTLALWNIETGECLRKLSLGTFGYMRSATFSKDGNIIASSGDDYTVILWNFQTGNILKKLSGHKNWVKSIDFHPYKNLLVSGSQDGTAKLWDISTGECIRTFTGHKGQINSVDFSRDGNLFASAGSDSIVRVWNIESEQCFRLLKGHTTWVQSISFHTENRILASGSQDNSIRLWDVYEGKCIDILQSHIDWIEAIKPSPDGQTIAVSSQTFPLQNYDIELWNICKESSVYRLSGHANPILSIDFTRDGKFLASGSSDHTTKIWNIETKKCIRTLHGHNDVVNTLNFSCTDKILATGSEDETVKIWDFNTGDCIRTLYGHMGQIKTVRFASTSKLLFSTSEDFVLRIWDCESWECLRTVKGNSNWIRSFSLHPSGSSFAAASDDYIARIWNIGTGDCTQTFQGHSAQIKKVNFNNDGQILVTGSDDCLVKMWNSKNGKCLATFEGHLSSIRSIQFNAKGDKIISADENGLIKIWNIRDGSCIRTLKRIKPYQEMNITGTKGLTETVKNTLKSLGAIENE